MNSGSPILDSVVEIRDAVAELRHRVDSIWYAGRDACQKRPEFTPEDNLKSINNEAFRLLQCCWSIENELSELSQKRAEAGEKQAGIPKKKSSDTGQVSKFAVTPESREVQQ